MSIVTKRSKVVLSLAVVIATLVVLVSQAMAHHGNSWTADYHSNRWFSWGKSFTYTHNTNVLDFNWGYGSPAPSLPVDDFGVRYRRTIHLDYGGWYQFDVAADGYALLNVNGKTLVNLTQPGLEYGRAKVYLHPGDNYVYAQYQEEGGIASVRVALYPTTAPQQNW